MLRKVGMPLLKLVGGICICLVFLAVQVQAASGDSTKTTPVVKKAVDSTKTAPVVKEAVDSTKTAPVVKKAVDSTKATEMNEAPKLKVEPKKTAKKVKKQEPKVITSKTGLKWIDHEVGEGDEAAKGDNVEVHYTGWLDDKGKHGKKFDSSHDRKKPFTFPLGQGRVIKGWDEGVAGMKIGGKRELFIPAKLGYGSRGSRGAIPPNADLIFEVELLKVTKPKK